MPQYLFFFKKCNEKQTKQWKVNRRTKKNERRKEKKKKSAIFIATLFIKQIWSVIIKSKDLLLLVYLSACLRMPKTFFEILQYDRVDDRYMRITWAKISKKILLWIKWVILAQFYPKLTEANISGSTLTSFWKLCSIIELNR